MNKILQATSRGQITLPKAWRDRFDTNYFKAEISDGKILIIPLIQAKSLEQKIEESWQEYKDGKYVTSEDLKEKYGL